MSELRRNIATDEWIIIAAERARRPEDYADGRERKQLPERDPNCPFCPGCEDKTPPEVMRLPAGQDPWSVRVFPNKFPALSWEDAGAARAVRHHDGWRLRIPGGGDHEVIVESSRHDLSLGRMEPEQVGLVLSAYHQRYLKLDENPDNELILIFRNHGPKAGTSLVHPHSQVIATPIVPSYIRDRLAVAQRHYDLEGTCVYCDMLAWELEDKARVVIDNDRFVAFCPYASGVPFECWIVPRHHAASFGAIAASEIRDLADLLHAALHRLHTLLGDPDYNYVIHTAPHHSAREPHYHWHLQLLPRLTTRAGFEIGSGIDINTTPPENAAQMLRGEVTAPAG